ncbi:MAG: sugar transferase [Bacteroidetes bacterium]|nr:sugar transferase [Bacteroidota bacterium]
MSRRKELISLLVGDLIAIMGSYVLFYWLRFYSGWFIVRQGSIHLPLVLQSAFVLYAFWLLAFLFFGLYRSWYVRPMFDEIVTVLKTTAAGTLAFMLVVLWDPLTPKDTLPIRNDPRVLGLLYFVCVSTMTVTVRLIVRYAQRRLLESGIGLRPAIVVGEYRRSLQLAHNLTRAKRLGYDVLGYVQAVTADDTHTNGQLRLLGHYDEIERVIETHKVREVLITLNSGEHDRLLDLLGRLSGMNVGLKILPDLYDIISGQARTREIYGFPLIDVNPEIMRPWEEVTKRVMDITISAIIIVIGLPVWILIALGVKLSSPGPVIYHQERVGKNGVPFQIFKFRSMSTDAEKGGPQWAQKNDPRVTPFGRFLRKTHLDEVPQFWNVLIGNMSLVGPRPERSYFVETLQKEIPYYRRRLRVRPGITSLYQATMDKYDETMDDVRNKLKYDLMYIESMSFRLDLKILLRTAYVMLRGSGQA